jgi:ElaB/YqjD/DUF883 family membrane-anchored ribosome-binding protein
MPRTYRRRASAVSPSLTDRIQEQAASAAAATTETIGQVQQAAISALDEFGTRMRATVDEVQERAAAAADFTVDVVYAGIGVIDLAQEEITARMRGRRALA